jgi:hypothetical protein
VSEPRRETDTLRRSTRRTSEPGDERREQRDERTKVLRHVEVRHGCATLRWGRVKGAAGMVEPKGSCFWDWNRGNDPL